ncbi:hypothetical protein HPB52_016286 [Rhipicephalus sanguineus]|uniref:Uncharacterized protein n=1 Tax=Rhipicephalus sanguineus TaxID=34632 RepID=A0A9D4QCJ8_RHISA|nr:hypothetical protein HPB52_016286 [Rhipicephalus sanguineus]
MAEYRDTIAGIAGFLTVSSFVGSLTMAWRVWTVGDSSGVAFLPMATTIICLHAWFHYGLAASNSDVTWASACGLVLMAVNAIVHRTFSYDSGPGTALVATLALMYTVLPMMSVAWLGKTALVCTLACNLAPIARILTFPLPEIGLWTVIICGLWASHGALARNVLLFVSNLVGVVVGSAEVALDYA